MQLSEYAKYQKRFGVRLARHLDMDPTNVYLWLSGKRKPPLKRCGEISQFCNGEVTCQELRPDIDWNAFSTSLSRGSNYAAA